MPLLIENGRVIDPSQGVDRVTNLLLEEGRVAALDVPREACETRLEARGMIVAPGLIDLHVELREPGYEEDETIAGGAAAALAGGFTTIACIPNTQPPIDTQAGVEFVRHQAEQARQANVVVIGCVSKGREGRELAEMAALAQAGAVAFTDAPAPLTSTDLLRRALQYCLMLDRPIFNHPEVCELTRGGIMHEGRTSLILGLAGMPAEAEDVMTSRDLRLAESTGGRLHLMNISSGVSVELIRRAKSRGMPVTAEVCPPHFTLTEESLRSFDSNCKVNPPLRTADDVAACIEGLRDGTLDCIASGHAPRSLEKKMQELDQAPFGMVGLETTLGLVVTRLIEPGHLDWSGAIRCLSTNPARVLGLNTKGTLAPGADADVTIIDPAARWVVNPAKFRTQSTNTPFAGWELVGRAAHVLVGGELRYSHGE